ncbi:2TM domain-containing protein [bacterium]|nr:2TM domain-containing protein [bacterium]
MSGAGTRTPEERARKRVDEFEGLVWHLVTFLIVNAFMWFIDINGGGGVEWAYWVTIPWGIGLLFHVAAYYIEQSGFRERKYMKALAQEQAKDARKQSAD